MKPEEMRRTVFNGWLESGRAMTVAEIAEAAGEAVDALLRREFGCIDGLYETVARHQRAKAFRPDHGFLRDYIRKLRAAALSLIDSQSMTSQPGKWSEFSAAVDALQEAAQLDT